jgi:hypothetical protein
MVADGRRGKVKARSDPFAALGLPARPDLTDDDVRSAWRRVATVTHPDRADGGDPERFAAAAAAYTALRTGFGRGEAFADLTAAPGTLRLRRWSRGRGRRRGWGRVTPRGLESRVRRGRPARLVLRAAVAAAAGAAAVLAVGWQPATPAVITGALTWLALTARHDLAPPD